MRLLGFPAQVSGTSEIMFESIQRGLSDALKKLRGRGRLTEANIRDGLQEIRTGPARRRCQFHGGQ